MIIDRHSEDIASRFVDETEAVALSSNDVGYGERYGRPALIPSLSVDCAGVRNRDDTRRHVSGKHRYGRILPPITDLEDLMLDVSQAQVSLWGRQNEL